VIKAVLFLTTEVIKLAVYFHINHTSENLFRMLCKEKKTFVHVFLVRLFCRFLTHCGRVTQICVFNTVKLGTAASSP